MAAVKLLVPKLNFRLEIENISQLNESGVYSPEYLIQGIPYHIKVHKRVDKNTSLSAFLFCAKKDRPADWYQVVKVSFKLLSFEHSSNSIEYHRQPSVYDSKPIGQGSHSIIRWDDLFDGEKKYVENNTIHLEINIEAEKPNQNRCVVNFRRMEKSCEENCCSTYRLSVSNIRSLMVVQTSEFKIRNLYWRISLYKHEDHLGLRLSNICMTKDASCKMTVTVKLLSMHEHVQGPRKTQALGHWNVLIIGNIIKWKDLLDQQQGFVNENSIDVEVKISTIDPELEAVNKSSVQSPKGDCPICLDTLHNKPVSTTKCGHLFCSACIMRSIRKRPSCPTCKAPVVLDDLIRVYLPV